MQNRTAAVCSGAPDSIDIPVLGLGGPHMWVDHTGISKYQDKSDKIAAEHLLSYPLPSPPNPESAVDTQMTALAKSKTETA